ncbi:MAG: right-handed parallel beta-helix repeat-containing protein [Actinobacteria bacterium]|nr:right-handed parallel beta-helix repeat-containing protein [Actinomycetota bacterium]
MTTANAVLDSLDISGTVVIDAPGVTIRNSRIQGDGVYGVQVVSGSVTITDSEIAGFENAITGSGWTARRVNIHSVTGDGVKVGSDVTLDASWIHDLDPAPGAHADGVQMQGGVTNLVLTGNTIDVGSDANSAIFLAPDLGPSSAGPVTVNGNWLDGGGYALFCVDGASGRYFVDHISITNNRFGSESRYGPVRINVPVTMSGNFDASGTLVQG